MGAVHCYPRDPAGGQREGEQERAPHLARPMGESGGRGPKPGAQAAADTFPKLLLRNAQLIRPAAGDAAQGFGDLADLDLGAGARRGARLPRACIGWAQARRHHRDRRLQPAAALLRRSMAAQALGAIPVPVYADAVADELAFVLAHAEVRFAAVEDQEQVDKILSVSEPAAEARADGLRRAEAGFATTTTPSCTPSTRWSPTAARRWRPIRSWRNGSMPRSRRARAPTSRSSSTPPAPPASPRAWCCPRERCIAAGSDTVAFDRLTEKDEALAYLPLAWVGDHYLNYAQGMVVGLLHGLPGERRHRDAGPARDRSDLLLRAAAHLRADADAADDPHGGRELHQAQAVPLFHRRGQRNTARRSSTAGGAGSSGGCSTGSAMFWCMRR